MQHAEKDQIDGDRGGGNVVGADQLLVPELLFRFHFFRRHVFYFQSAPRFWAFAAAPGVRACRI